MGAVSFSIDARLVAALREALPLEAFVETGTFKGDAIEAVRADFARIVSVELSEPLWREASERFAGAANVELHRGDSAEVLRRVVPALARRPALFWLDAHWCVADRTAGDRSQCPLLAEIAALGALAPGSVVLIDDARLFLAPPPEPHDVTQWPTLDEVVRALRAASASHELMVVNDVIAFYPPEARDAIHRYARAHGMDWLRATQSLAENAGLRAALEEKHSELLRLRETADEREQVIARQQAALDQVRGLQRSLEEKQAVIDEVSAALNAYRRTLAPFGFILRPLGRVIGVVRHWMHRLWVILAPRLGNLNQHEPRALELPRRYREQPPASPAPKISIVTPSFRQARFIERTIESVLAQGYPNLEYHVQDGGSDDGTREILERFDARLTSWESRRDNGQTHAINLGFARTSGEIMAWLNSDDILLPGALAYVADFFNRHPDVDVVYGHRILIDEQDRQIGRWMLPAHSQEVLSWADFVPQETLFWRRGIWEKAGGRVDESYRFAMDWDLLVRFREAGARFARLPRFIGGFRIHEQQKTSAVINDIGFQEMDRIRQRMLGRVPSAVEVRKAVAPYLLKHCAIDLGWRIQSKLGLHS